MMLCVFASADGASAQPAAEPAFSGPPITDHPSPPTVSLLTIGPGDIFFERFGHNAIVVRGPASGESLAYNYGIFDFDQQDFLLNFARGRMRYRMAVDDLADDLAMYRDEGREITEQRLALTPEQTQRLVEFLEWNARPENAQYHYDYWVDYYKAQDAPRHRTNSTYYFNWGRSYALPVPLLNPSSVDERYRPTAIRSGRYYCIQSEQRCKFL